MRREQETELDYYTNVLQKIRNKKYEFYVISRIIHLLDNRKVEIATQQHVNTENGRFLLDLYFPQIRLAVEVDEPHHVGREKQDKNREKAVVEVRDVQFERIKINGQPIDLVNERIDEVLGVIRQKINEQKNASQFVPFIYGQKYKPEFWLKKRRLSVSDDARFRTHVDVARLFGREYKGHQKALITLEDNKYVWFPKLYANGAWDNQLIPGGKKIVQRKLSSGNHSGGKNNITKGTMMIVFAHHKDEFGQIYYAFKGVFEVISQVKRETKYTRRFDTMKFDGKGDFKLINTTA